MEINFYRRLIFIFLFACLTSCKKQPGIGGDATIAGNIHAKHFNTTFTQYISQYPAADVYVYLVPGTDVTYIKRIKTDYNGNYEFKYLYQGNYTVYAYSLDSTFSHHVTTSSGSVAVTKQISIKGRKEIVTADTLQIFN